MFSLHQATSRLKHRIMEGENPKGGETGNRRSRSRQPQEPQREPEELLSSASFSLLCLGWTGAAPWNSQGRRGWVSLKGTAILGNQASFPPGGRKAQRDTSSPPPRKKDEQSCFEYPLGGRGLVQEGSQGWKARTVENWAGMRNRTGSYQASLGQTNSVLGIGSTE